MVLYANACLLCGCYAALTCFAGTHMCLVCCLPQMQVGKLIYCTRTVPEMEKVLRELQVLLLPCLDVMTHVTHARRRPATSP
jgi:hypothetical protein